MLSKTPALIEGPQFCCRLGYQQELTEQEGKN